MAGLSAALLLAAVVPSAHAGVPRKGLSLGLQDGVYQSTDPVERELWLDRTVEVGADTVGLTAAWNAIAPNQPADPADPADPAYRWSRLDPAVRDATGRGLRVMITLNSAPRWAEGGNRDPDAPQGTWRPDPGKLAQFARAISTRYSGSFPDPGLPGGSLPQVRLWQVWAEPNIRLLLNPQWKRRKGEWRMFSTGHYRKMLNAAYKAINDVSRSNLVIAAGTAPFGEYTVPGETIPPLRFWREVLCLRGSGPKGARCPDGPARFDVLAHNPLSWFALTGDGDRTSPWNNASQVGGGPADVVVRDMKKLQSVLRKARSRRTIRPRRGTRLWVTELLWETNPPDPLWVSLRRQADFLADSLYLLWRQGVSEVHWVHINDTPYDSESHTLQSGLYLENGEPKPSRLAFRFPFTAVRRHFGLRVWGRAPAPGPIQIQDNRTGDWRTIKTLRTGRSNVFTGKVRGRHGELRAAAGGETSLTRRPRR
jgi:hypothetical protein